MKSFLRALGLFAVLFAVFAAIALRRLIDADEGYLLFAARLVAEGKTPYADFFFPQPPAFPHLFALVQPMRWNGARLLAAALTALTGMFIAVTVRRRGLATRHAWWAAALFATSALAFGWLPIAKTYALAAPLLCLAHCLSLGPLHRVREPVRAVLIGLLLGLAVATRLYLALVVAVILWNAHRNATKRSRSFVAWSALGLAMAVAPFARVLWRGRQALAFDLVEYHARLVQMSLGASLLQKASTLARLFGFATEDRALGLQITALVAVVVIGHFLRTTKPERAWRDPTVCLLIALFVLTIAPTPTYVQYFCLCVPFLVELAVVELAASHRFEDARRERIRAITAFVAASYFALGALEVRRHCVTGERLIGIESSETAWKWRIDTVRAISRQLDDRANCGPVVASWPGHLVETSLSAWPGTESHFGVFAAMLLPNPHDRQRQRVLSREDLWAGAIDDTLVPPRLVRTMSTTEGVSLYGVCSTSW